MKTLIPARILRADAEAAEPLLADLNHRERLQRERILRHAPTLFARYGRAAISFGNFAIALKMAPATLRKHFADLDALLAHILGAYLVELGRAIGDIPQDAPDRHAARRAAYLRFTRLPFGGLTDLHALLVHQTRLLPADLRAHVESFHHQLGELCAGARAAQALSMLDTPCFEPAEIEAALAGMAQPQAEAPPTQAPLIRLPPAIRPVPKIDDENDEGQDTLSRISGVKIPFGNLFATAGPPLGPVDATAGRA